MTFPQPVHNQVASGEHVGKIPIREVSGLALRKGASEPEVLAVGDHDFELAVGKLAGGAIEKFDVIDLGQALRRAGVKLNQASQWEGITSDALGRVFVLEENPGHVFAFDATGKQCLATIELGFDARDNDFIDLAEAWAMNPNSRGEGLVLLAHGHLLVLKEKEPRRLIEFGPHGDLPVGLRPTGGRGIQFSLPAEQFSKMAPLRDWKFSEESKADFPDLSDLQADETGRLWVLSEEGRALGMVTGEAGDGRLQIGSITKLSATPGLDHPEGLVLLGQKIALVACDQHERHTPLYSFKLKPDAP